VRKMKRQSEVILGQDHLWYKDAIIYELHVKAFKDSSGDGTGDLRGLTSKLDYLEGLGVTAVWLLPFYPSPLRDDGYDISDYFNVNPKYGELRDFREFLREAHRRGIRVITELVLNHTSDQHAWFQRSRKAKKGSVFRDYYVWSDSPEQYGDARVIFKDFETSNWAWDPLVHSYYWHRFYSHQPDLNFENPHVQKTMTKVIDYWFSMGVDGLRLDAVPYLYEREGTNCENLPETFAFLAKLRAHVDKNYKGKMLLAEANQWPEDAVTYFGSGDMCHMAFHFPLMPRIFMALWMEDRFPVLDIFEQTPAIPVECQWALFLRNHDELTLEMVTDEERDYMYRVYARDPTARINLGIRRRLAPLLNNHMRKIELMNFLLFSLPGTPVIYYGDEIGMGDNYYLGDRNGVRTPMQWSSDRNAGFSNANPQRLYLPIIIDPEYHYEAINAENQERNQFSLLWWMKRAISVRKYFKAFGRGSIRFLNTGNSKVLAFMREYGDEKILVIANLSRYPQNADLDLSEYYGYTPEEVFSRNKFPVITDSSRVFTLGSHDYFWFSLEREEESVLFGDIFTPIAELRVSGDWEAVFGGRTKERLEEEILPVFLPSCRWFGGKARTMRSLKIIDDIRTGGRDSAGHLLLLRVLYSEGLPDTYLLPVSFIRGPEAQKVIEEQSYIIIARLKSGKDEGVLCDGVYSPEFRRELLRLIAGRHVLKGAQGEIFSYRSSRFSRSLWKELAGEKSVVLKAEQSNTSLLYLDKLFFKLFRRLDEGLNPDLEIGRFLSERARFPRVPAFYGAAEYRVGGSEPTVIGILQGYVPNEGDAWRYAVNAVSRYFEGVRSKRSELREMPRSPSSIFDVRDFTDIPSILQEMMGGDCLEMVALLGRRTAELHRALSSETEDPAFAPEPFSVLYQRSVYQSMQSLTKRNLQLLLKNLASLPGDARDEGVKVLDREKDIIERFKGLLSKKIATVKTRVHGDLHLGQVLFTGNDFLIIDFEGEPERALSERRLKRSPFIDVAGMMRSFHYAAYSSLFKQILVAPDDASYLEAWAEHWYINMTGLYLSSYLENAQGAVFLPAAAQDVRMLLDAFILEKAIYEVGYELNNRPDWVKIPLKGISRILGRIEHGGQEGKA
jgi:maltose alpha-D-glucosyltransferase / alpha-amylase